MACTTAAIEPPQSREDSATCDREGLERWFRPTRMMCYRHQTELLCGNDVDHSRNLEVSARASACSMVMANAVVPASSAEAEAAARARSRHSSPVAMARRSGNESLIWEQVLPSSMGGEPLGPVPDPVGSGHRRSGCVSPRQRRPSEGGRDRGPPIDCRGLRHGLAGGRMA